MDLVITLSFGLTIMLLVSCIAVCMAASRLGLVNQNIIEMHKQLHYLGEAVRSTAVYLQIIESHLGLIAKAPTSVVPPPLPDITRNEAGVSGNELITNEVDFDRSRSPSI